MEKTIAVQASQKVVLDFDHPEIKLSTWDKKEIGIRGTSSINRGENDNAFELQVTTTGPEIRITSVVKDKENLPHHIMIKKGDTEYFFKAKDFKDPEVQKFFEQNGREYAYMSSGVIIEVKLEIFVPKGMTTSVLSKYGIVEVTNFDGPLTVDSKYGGVDATITPATTGVLVARSRYGEILTNLGVAFDQKGPDRNEKWTEISAKIGSGSRYEIEAKYGNVYLRKPK
ncbi:MAG TPA: hypothetical protein VG737_03545 [Cyclobacteriaceae bacterium]|nr:hypothetical protein [Cyclobacteriaceae bacterium]